MKKTLQKPSQHSTEECNKGDIAGDLLFFLTNRMGLILGILALAMSPFWMMSEEPNEQGLSSYSSLQVTNTVFETKPERIETASLMGNNGKRIASTGGALLVKLLMPMSGKVLE